ncbi:GLPGLI family protein [Flavobacterium saccharophilum]|uniref:GLPGLI family protein n=1 Tax=Flavobacterium saccharophilum TaxID=29534 RepID=A0A1M7BFD7_9FLAO|nr:GLPGLI family protein [Flavobacterium saccharophilum]SHL53661.1 GLPGLI family protein [Flavobacterium saccharophilum]
MKYFFFSLLFTSIVYSQQTVIVTYDFHTSFSNNELKNEDAKKLFGNTVELANNQKFQLSYSENKASFKYIDQLGLDSDPQLLNISRMAFTSLDVYTNLEAKAQITVRNDGTLVESKITPLDWEITAESKNIGGYLCYKALFNENFIDSFGKNRSTKIVAWFAPSLPFSLGPKYFYGLPGLILEVTEYVNSHGNTFLANTIELRDKKENIKFPNGKTVTKEEYDKKFQYSDGAVLLAKKREETKGKE